MNIYKVLDCINIAEFNYEGYTLHSDCGVLGIYSPLCKCAYLCNNGKWYVTISDTPLRLETLGKAIYKADEWLQAQAEVVGRSDPPTGWRWENTHRVAIFNKNKPRMMYIISSESGARAAIAAATEYLRRARLAERKP
jgi:hypothetical protein